MLYLKTLKGIMCNKIIRTDGTTGKAETTKMTVTVAALFAFFFFVFVRRALLIGVNASVRQ